MLRVLLDSEEHGECAISINIPPLRGGRISTGEAKGNLTFAAKPFPRRTLAVTFSPLTSLYTVKAMSGSEPAPKVRLDSAREAEERRLVEAARQDRARFVDLYDEYFELVYAYVVRRTRNRDEAEDLAAEVFRKALENLSRFKWTGAPFGAWLLRIASNLIADRGRRQARELSSGPRAGKGATSPQTQQRSVEDAERRAMLFRMVDGLSDDQRRVIQLRFGEEKSIREIAAETRRTEGAVKQLQFRALENLRKRLSPQRTQSKTRQKRSDK
jgi:RNA polymerase sigma-70 factor (ECF subfamily)